MTSWPGVLAFAEAHSVLAAVAIVAAAAAVLAGGVLAARAARAVRAVVAGHQAADVSTIVSAAVATSVALTGMWRFFGTVLHFSGPDRVATFAFIELAMVTEAFRARRNIRESAARAEHARQRGDQPEPVTAGVDGAAVWVLSGLSAVLSSLAARSAAEVVLRLTAPLIAAWLWERGLSLYRRQLTGRRMIHWRVTPERILVKLGLAEPTGRTAGEVAAQRRVAQLARAAKRARVLRDTGAAGWRKRWAMHLLDAAMTRALEDASLATDTSRQDALLAQLGALHGASELAALTPPAPWQHRPVLTGGVDPAGGPPAELRPAPVLADLDGDSAGITAAGPVTPVPAASDTSGEAGRPLTKKEQAARLLASAPPMPEDQLPGWLAGQLGITTRYGRQLRAELATAANGNGSGPGPHNS
jgi:hypothetical protein